MKNWSPDIFRAYDIRGVYPQELNEEAAYDIAQAYVQFLKPKNVVLGRDVRLSGEKLWQAAALGITDLGVDVIDIGVISTDMLYFATAFWGYDGGFIFTGSHNPAQYNGMKMVRQGSRGISSDSGLLKIKSLALNNKKQVFKKKGRIIKKDILEDYLAHIKKFAKINNIRPLKIVGNANFGSAGKVAEKLTQNLPIQWVKLNWERDGTFPKGRPDPLIPESRKETIQAVKKNRADLAVAWDADADRCFFYDENGKFIEGYFITALLAEYFLQKYPKSIIISDPRLTWAVIDKVKQNRGKLIIFKTGHMFIKEKMRREKAIFAGEMSGHYYFKDNFYTDNGMIPFWIMLEILSCSAKKMSQLFLPYTSRYFVSEELNFEVDDKERIIHRIENNYKDGKISHIDGLSCEFDREWRFNLRPSNTESLLRLNVEANSPQLLKEKVRELVKEIST